MISSSSSYSSSLLTKSSAFALVIGIGSTYYYSLHKKVWKSVSNVLSNSKSLIYDTLILHMTTKWYEVVLEDVSPHAILLDVGIGTGSALLNCKDMLRQKDIKVIGIDYDQQYVTVAKQSIIKESMEDYIHVIHMSVYDVLKRQDEFFLPSKSTTSASSNVQEEEVESNHKQIKSFDAIYFSGSFSLLPDMFEAINVTSQLLRMSSKLYITQTYQRKSTFLLSYIKPILKYIITIDFGQLIFEKDANDLFHHQIPNQCSPNTIALLEHKLIPGSIDNVFQAAYVTILEKKN